MFQTCTGSTSHRVEDSSMGTHNGSTSHWVEDSSMGTNIGSASHWIEDSSMGTYVGSTHYVEAGRSRLPIALWGHTLDQYTMLRQVEIG